MSDKISIELTIDQWQDELAVDTAIRNAMDEHRSHQVNDELGTPWTAVLTADSYDTGMDLWTVKTALGYQHRRRQARLMSAAPELLDAVDAWEHSDEVRMSGARLSSSAPEVFKRHQEWLNEWNAASSTAVLLTKIARRKIAGETE